MSESSYVAKGSEGSSATNQCQDANDDSLEWDQFMQHKIHRHQLCIYLHIKTPPVVCLIQLLLSNV